MKKVKPFPLDNLPKGLKPVFTTMTREFNNALSQETFTPEQLRIAFRALENWAIDCAGEISGSVKTAAT